MKKLLLILLVLAGFSALQANGVAVVNHQQGVYLKLQTSNILVNVENQVAITKTTQTFVNQFGNTVNFKYAFPMPEGANAINLRWHIDGEWHEAVISHAPQDTTFPGGGDPNEILDNYLGATPLYFNIAQAVGIDSSVTVELTYVELLPYFFGKVNYNYPADYSAIQSEPLLLHQFEFNLVSGRTINNIALENYTPTNTFNDGNNAKITLDIESVVPDKMISVNYTLATDELGLFSFSTFLPDSVVPDEGNGGFFTFVAEPEPGDGSQVIQKYFTLIVDRSGSMAGNKIIQAKSAANYIVNHLNDDDFFNIVDFSSNVGSFSGEHVLANAANRESANSYINNIYDGGGTNISGAFETAIPQFSAAGNNTANIIIFLTDGEATAGIVETPLIIELVDSLVSQTETDINLFTFGIGEYTNTQLLTQLAVNNKGASVFLANQELEEVITGFYNMIANPVLINTSISFSPETAEEIYPDPLPNLYLGNQMIVSGRYSQPGDVTLTLSGTAFGQDVSYEYTLSLADSQVNKYSFLPKVWAKQKLEYMMVQYYLLDENSPEAMTLKEQIQDFSVLFGVISPFTSFTGGGTGVEEEEELTENDKRIVPEGFALLGNYPNPFNPSTVISFSVGQNLNDVVKIKIYNSLGELVRVLEVHVNGQGIYEARWDGLLDNGMQAASDVYVYVVDFGKTLLAGKMVLMK